jgi:hypothetical protein
MQSAREICIDGPDFDRVSFHKEFNAEVLTFFRKHLTDASNPEQNTFSAAVVTLPSPGNDSYQVGNDEMNRHCLSSQVLQSTG